MLRLLPNVLLVCLLCVRLLAWGACCACACAVSGVSRAGPAMRQHAAWLAAAAPGGVRHTCAASMGDATLSKKSFSVPVGGTGAGTGTGTVAALVRTCGLCDYCTKGQTGRPTKYSYVPRVQISQLGRRP